MVLRPKNFAKAPANENQSPAASRAVPSSKGLMSRLGLADASHRRRSKTSGMTRTTKYAIEQAKRRNDMAKKATKSPMVFKVTRPPAVNDVVMGDSSSSSQAKVTQLHLPKELGRPEYKEIDKEVIVAIDATAADTDIEYIREGLESISTDLAMSLTCTKIQTTRNELPKELTVIVNDMCSILPTHVLAIFDGQAIRADPARPRKVTLYPVHSLVLAANCAHMPKPPATLPVPVHQKGEQEVTLPVWSLALPSPLTYPHLSVYLYTKRVEHLMGMMLPSPPPADWLEKKEERVLSYAKRLSQTFTVQALTMHIYGVHGLWQNVCTMGIFDTRLWDALDWMWATLLTALAIATGEPGLMIPSASEQQQEQ